MSDYSNFVSKSSIDERQKEIRKARNLILEKAKKKFEAEEIKEKRKKESGESKWILDSVSKRIDKEEKMIEEAKSKSKKKKEKKKKKKKKKKKHRKKESESSSSSSDEDSDEGEKWVDSKTVAGSKPSPGKPLQRESWMEAPLDFLPLTSRQDIRDAANKEKEKAKVEAEKASQPGQHARELNPYWKNGGSGLPTSAPSSKPETSMLAGGTGDGGLSWLLKALSRMKQQASDEGRSLEEIAAERYGSLDQLMSMIRDAERVSGRGGYSVRKDKDYDQHHRKQFAKPGETMRNDYNNKDKLIENGRRGEKDHDSDREKDKVKLRARRRSTEREKMREKRGGRERDRLEEDEDRRGDRGGRRIGFQRPVSDEEENEDRHTKTSGSHGKMFKRPDDSDNNDKRRGGYERHTDELRRRRDKEEGWRKSSYQGMRDSPPRWKKKEASSTPEEVSDRRRRRREDKPKRKSSGSSSSSSRDSSGDEESDSTRQTNPNRLVSKEEVLDVKNEEIHVAAPPKIMSEEELNDLAAKVLRAEIMGDENLATELKARLEEARRVREASKSGGGRADFMPTKRDERGVHRDGKEEEREEEDNVVVLSRTSKNGLTRPVLSSTSDDWGQSAGKKRKRKNVMTHDESGERTKFFHDDDKFDLKTLVEREKAGTAEDQNSMFSRLAGRETDRDMDMDDMFVSKAARNQEEENSINRDKMAAIMEHRKRSSAMEKCTRCFDKVPKHLIVAIGRKSYLCLPDHASLTEGHCLIVPMAHNSSATSLDEDVWQDMQIFRKSLVQMFLEQDKDVVVMETVMGLKHFPHTAIECVPLEKEVGDLAPIYFKKALQEVGPEWSDNKKVHDLSKKDIRHTIPKGFPYFSVDFGLQGGFAHVIEDEATFPGYFGREIVGGMLDAEPSLWRKPRKQNFEDQRQKVLQFEQWWSPFDWTRDIA